VGIRVSGGSNYKAIDIIFINTSHLKVEEMEKNKSLMRELHLAKIAHELKNPINTIHLLIKTIEFKKDNEENPFFLLDEEVQKNMNMNDKNSSSASEVSSRSSKPPSSPLINGKESFALISNLCEFIMMLIEDLNDFIKPSTNQTCFSEQDSKSQVNIRSTLKFVHSIFSTRQKHDPNKPN